MLGEMEEGAIDFSSFQGRVLTGQVKTFNAKMGRGFIECEEVKEMYEKDIYVHGSVLQKAGANVGDMVEFTVHLNKEGLPQASSPLKVIGSGFETAAHQGRVKSFSEKSGYGFVECPELFEQYGRDVFLPKEMAFTCKCMPGEEVVFNIDLNRDGMPVVNQIWLAHGGRREEVGKGGKGCFNCGGPHLVKDCQEGPAGKGQWDDGWAPVKGKGKWDSKGKWDDGHERRVGTQYAPGYEPDGKASKGKGKTSREGKSVKKGAKEKSFDADDMDDLGRLINDLNAEAETDEEMDGGDAEEAGVEAFTGRVKSFNAQHGYGFVECEETFTEFGHDIQVPKGVSTKLTAGEQVSFKIDMNDEGMPVVTEIWPAGPAKAAKRKRVEVAAKAKKVQKVAKKPVPKEIDEEDGEAAFDPEEELGEELGGAPADGETYEGEIISFDCGSGRGFISCEGVKATFDQDVYVHRKVLAQAKANVGDVVRFTIHVNSQGLPQASHPLEIIKSNGPKLEYKGIIKSFSEKSGYGFLGCPEVFEMHGRDAYLPGSKAKNTYVGQEVFFAIDLNNDGMPVVHEMHPAVIEDIKGGGKGGKDAKGAKGKDSKGKDAGKWKGQVESYYQGSGKGSGKDYGKDYGKGYGDKGYGDKGHGDKGYGAKGYGMDYGYGKGADLHLGAFGGGAAWGGGWDDPYAAKGYGAGGPGKFGAKGHDFGGAAWDGGYGKGAASKGKFGPKGAKTAPYHGQF